jgi:hypothetical protein
MVSESREQLLEKLKPKKTTDGCHTSDDSYDKVKERLFKEYKQFLEKFKQEAKETTRTIHELGIIETLFKAIETGEKRMQKEEAKEKCKE